MVERQKRRRVTIIGAGLSGLGVAVELADLGWQVRLFERSPQAGGRCRSYFDSTLKRKIDNGNHMLLSGNPCADRYLTKINARHTFYSPFRCDYPFQDVLTGDTWTVSPDKGLVPWSLLRSKNRVPGASLKDYLAAFRLAFAKDQDCVADCLDTNSILFRKLWEPLTVSILNTQAVDGQARILWRVLKQTFFKGADACRPMIAKKGLSESLVDPALSLLRDKGAEIYYSENLKSIQFVGNKARSLQISGKTLQLDDDEQLVLAITPDVVKSLIPNITVPDQSRGIINVHFVLPKSVALGDETPPRFIGLVGGLSHWLFIRGDVASITISAADGLMDMPKEKLATALWREICCVLKLGNEVLGPWKIIREKRATFACTPPQCASRADSNTPYENVTIAGDWTNTGLPATMEGALQSSQKVVSLLEK